MYLPVMADDDGPDMNDVYEQILFDGHLYGKLWLRRSNCLQALAACNKDFYGLPLYSGGDLAPSLGDGKFFRDPRFLNDVFFSRKNVHFDAQHF